MVSNALVPLAQGFPPLHASHSIPQFALGDWGNPWSRGEGEEVLAAKSPYAEGSSLLNTARCLYNSLKIMFTFPETQENRLP